MRSLISIFSYNLAHSRLFILLLLGSTFLGFLPWIASPYGLDVAAPVDSFVNDTFPSGTPGVGSGSWITTNAFPHLTFNDPIHLVEEPGTNRLLIGEHGGRIIAVTKDSSTTVKNTILDISGQTFNNGESGMLGFAIHPRFGIDSNYIYVFYKTKISNIKYYRVSRFTVPTFPGPATLGSEMILIQQLTQANNHNGGSLFFGKDGYLYISSGDEGGGNNVFNNGQIIDNRLLGGVFRIDVDKDPTKSHAILRQPATISGGDLSYSANYYIPNDNPFLDPLGGYLEEFYALGFRNPHRMTYDSVADEIWIGDVGEGSREEIDKIIKGGNYQWGYKEGTNIGPQSMPGTLYGTDEGPIHEYDHSFGISVIGGYVYRASTHPDLVGKYLFADYSSKRLWSLKDSSGTILIDQLMTLSFPIGSFGIDGDGEVYLLQYDTNGKIYLLDRQNAGAPEPPALLSQAGVFQSLSPLVPEDFMIPYELNAPFWSDNAIKTRWMVIPNDGTHDTPAEKIQYSENGDWIFPEGAVLVKHFELPLDETNPGVKRHIETRFLIHGNAGEYYGITYRWRDNQLEADLLIDNQTDTFTVATATGSKTVNWYYPGRGECLSCHIDPAQVTLGPKTRQLNGDQLYPVTGKTSNQLATMTFLSMFDTDPDTANLGSLMTSSDKSDLSASLEDRARSYLDANCASCHRPGNSMQANFDARMSTPLTSQGLIYGTVFNELGSPGDRVIIPGQPERSILYKRLNSVHSSIAMPLLAKNHIDTSGTKLIFDWISSIPASTSETALLGQNIDFSAITNKTVGDAPFVLAATASSGLPITYQVLSGPASVVGNTVTLSGSDGYIEIRATQTGDASYDPAPEYVRGFWVMPAGKGVGTGLDAKYYSDTAMTVLVQNHTDPQIDFYWGSETAMPGSNYDEFAIVWEGEIEAPYSETFTFTTSTDDGVRLWVDNVLLVDHWGDQPVTDHSGSIAMNAWTRVAIRMEFYENKSYASAQLKWSSPSLSSQVVPMPFLYPSAGAVLPYELVEFTATPQHEHVQLQWITANEQQTSSFSVEKSLDGVRFHALEEVPALGPHADLNTYESIDRSPSLGTNYYRLKQFDQNGAFSYSEVLTVEFQPQTFLSVFPNPVLKGSILTAEVVMADAGPFLIQIHSPEGKLVRQFSHAGIRTRTQLSLEISNLAEGLYVISMKSQGKLLSAKRILIQAK
ncbi:MAG: PQQ-dependent sugar dehydrogenase [Bacteroidota bacterium]